MEISVIFSLVFSLVALTTARDCLNKSNTKLLCYYSKIKDVDSCHCSHIILPANFDVKSIDTLREKSKGVKILLTVHQFNEELVNLVNNGKIDGLELNLKKLDSKTDISDFISTVRHKLGSNLYLVLSIPPKAELLAKYFDFKVLSKNTDLFILQTAFLGANKNVTFHPSRLSGLWDMQNADSVVDLVTGLGAPLSKLVLTAPVQAFQFTLQDEEHTAPGSPALDVITISRDHLCDKMSANNWTLERDQDQAGPYIFRKNEWIAFDDAISIDIKAKYSRVRGLGGLALKDVTQDGGKKCGGTLLEAAFNDLSKQARAPRGVVLHSLEREILERPKRQLENIHLSPYRISRVIDVEGKVHVIRQDTRTEFECSRQGYFVHPRSCGRFYRCVKFDQLTDEYSVFEFDCPAGLAFDNRVEVCVWPGSLPHASACAGSSEIAPVPKERFVCPGEAGYYADPENCRWFFACLDHGKSHLTPYEFRCPFGLVFDQDHLLCEWPWLVPKCANGANSGVVLGLYQPSVTVHGGKGLAGTGSLLLEQYDGLGSLGRVTLGGVAGPLEVPVAKVYSSFATQGAGQSISGEENHSAALVGGSQGGQVNYVNVNSGIGVGGVAYVGTNGRESVTSSGDSSLLNIGYRGNHGASLLGGSQNEQVNYVNLVNAGVGAGGAAYLGTDGRGLVASSDDSSLLNAGYGGINQNGRVNYKNVNSGIGAGGAAYLRTDDRGLVASTDDSSLLNTGYAGNDGAVLVGGSQNEQVNYLNVNNGVSAEGTAYLGTEGHGLTTSSDESSLLNTGYRGNVKYLSTIDQNFQIGSEYQNEARVGLNAALDESNQGYENAGVGGTVILQANEINNNKFLKTSNALRGSTRYQGSDLNSQIGSYEVGQTDSKSTENLNTGYVRGVALQSANLGAINANSGHNLQSNKFTNVDGSNLNLHDSNSYNLVTPAPQLAHGPADYSNIVVHEKAQSGLNTGTLNSEYSSVTGENTHNTAAYGENDYIRSGYSAQNVGIGVSQIVTEADGQSNTAQFFGKSDRGLQSQGVQSYGNVNIGGQDAIEDDGVQFIQKSDNQNRGVAGSIDIIGGGFSAVKLGSESRSGVQVIQHGTNIDGLEHVTQIPVSVTPSSISTANIPVVTSVPVPAIKTATGFDIYKGGVVANVPELQYKVDSPKSINNAFYGGQINENAFSRGSSSFANSSRSLVGYSSSTAVPLLAVTGGYTLSKPAVSFVKEYSDLEVVSPTVSTINQDYTKSAGSVSYVQHQSEHIQQPIVEAVQPTQSAILVTHQTPATILEETVQPVVIPQAGIATSNSYHNANHKSQSYVYTNVEEITQKPAVVSTYSISQPTVLTHSEPANHVVPVHQPAGVVLHDISRKTVVAPFISISQPTTTAPLEYEQPVQPQQSYSYQQSDYKSKGYVYTKPTVNRVVPLHQPAGVIFEEVPQKTVLAPIVSTTVAPLDYVEHIQPQQIYNYQNSDHQSKGYVYAKPSIVFEEEPRKPAIVSTFSISQPTAVTELPLAVQPTPISLQGYQHSIHHSNNYLSNKSAIYFEQKPQAEVFSGGYPLHDQKLILQPQIQQVQSIQKGAAYSYQNIQNSAQSQNYDYSKSDKNIGIAVTPASVATYTLQQPAEFEKKVEVAPVIVNSYHYQKPVVQKAVNIGYSYPKPSVQFVEEPTPIVTNYENIEPVKEEPFVARKAYVTGYQKNVHVNPNTVESYSISSNPAYEEAVYSTPKPLITLTSRPIINQYVLSTPKPSTPAIIEDYYISSTPKPTYVSTVASVIAAKSEQPLTFYSYDSRLSSTPKSIPVAVKHSRPISRYSFSSLDQEYNNFGSTSVPVVQSTASVIPEIVTATPVLKTVSEIRPGNRYSFNSLDQKYNFVSTPSAFVAPIVPEAVTPVPVVTVTQSRPISRYSFSLLDNKYSNYVSNQADSQSFIDNFSSVIIPKTLVTDARRKNYVSTVAPTKEALDISSAIPIITTTSRPISRYSFSSLDDKYAFTSSTPTDLNVVVDDIAVSTPKTEPYYVAEISTTAKPTYIPPKAVQYVENYDTERLVTKSRRPVKVVKLVRPRTQAIVKVNDFHPLLAAKLGAQCTCVSNTLSLKKKPIRVQIYDDDDDDVDEYVVRQDNNFDIVDNGEANLLLDSDFEQRTKSVAVEDYKFEPEKVVEITPIPEVIRSTSVVLPVVRKRVRVRPYSSTTVAYDNVPVTKVTDIFLKSTAVPSIQFIPNDDEPNQKDVEDVVRKGLSLIKSAAKQGAKEAIAENMHDRYGPGGVRSRDDTLQGTVDCQRAGLFRHPDHCNKFYACRWDCTKKRFTLHIFNCPVHLTFDNNLGACNWPSQGPACLGNTLLPSD